MFHHFNQLRLGRLQQSSSSTAERESISSMSVSEIKKELQERKVSFADCFDKESLILKLIQARNQSTADNKQNDEQDDDSQKEDNSVPDTKSTRRAPADVSTTTSTNNQDMEKVSRQTNGESQSSTAQKQPLDQDELQQIRSMRVRELREELARRNQRWGGLLEKEDLVQAVHRARMQAASFSVTGMISPGQVADLTGDQLDQELTGGGKNSAPLLLDAYAVWCGPCQLMASTLKEVASEFHDRIRVAELDTDQYPQQAGRFRIQGLPTLLLFVEGKEVARVEGALNKNQLISWVESKL